MTGLQSKLDRLVGELAPTAISGQRKSSWR